ncbi:MAG: 23S rRNA (adenine(1618)-N(6))-methyltransferase RlmF [Bacteroidota bacterium]|nr:23S rRNA (adenine(1618)-N(6))-methyltransferase RlmF [Bacteroidota bacterium]
MKPFLKNKLQAKKIFGEKMGLHGRNKHRFRYNFRKLVQDCPELEAFVFVNTFDDETIDFANPEAVKILNRALLKHFYGIANWDIPEGYLCPPIPGRADYIHYMADLLADYNNDKIPKGNTIKVLDIGTGANCVYPIIGHSEYGWRFVGSDIDPLALVSAQKIIDANPQLGGNIELRLQKDPSQTFKGIIHENECFDLSICNPPFHASLAEAMAGTNRKMKNLGFQKSKHNTRNFGGKNNELWCAGGEKSFVRQLIRESAQFPLSCSWYSTLVSKKENLPGIYQQLKLIKAIAVKTINMSQGQKSSRVVAWTFTDRNNKVTLLK